MKLFLIDDVPRHVKHAGFKARMDVINSIKTDIKDITIQRIGSNLSFFSRVTNFLIFLFFLAKRKKGDVVIVNYPLAQPLWSAISLAKKISKVKIIALIHDLESLKGKSLADYVNLRLADIVISHNSAMSTLLMSNGIVNNNIINLEIFDYLMPTLMTSSYNPSKAFIKRVIFAGNLSVNKSKFIYQWKPDFEVSLYGINYDNSMSSSSLVWHGSFHPDNPNIETDDIAFGLVWDGDSINECAGLCGDYLRYNNPHKISLYLSQGLPVIVWNNSALAHFVEENNLGFAVGSLKEIDDILFNIDRDEYELIKKSAIEIGNKLREGDFVRKAIFKSLKNIPS